MHRDGVSRNSRKQHLQSLRSAFQRDGFVLIPDLFSVGEVDRLRTRCETDSFSPNATEHRNLDGISSKIDASDRNTIESLEISDILSSRLTGVVGALLDDEVC